MPDPKKLSDEALLEILFFFKKEAMHRGLIEGKLTIIEIPEKSIDIEQEGSGAEYNKNKLKSMIILKLRDIASDEFNLTDIDSLNKGDLIKKILETQEKNSFLPYTEDELKDLSHETLKIAADEDFNIDNVLNMSKDEIIEKILEIQKEEENL
jgi:Rho termination factor-like protein